MKRINLPGPTAVKTELPNEHPQANVNTLKLFSAASLNIFSDHWCPFVFNCHWPKSQDHPAFKDELSPTGRPLPQSVAQQQTCVDAGPHKKSGFRGIPKGGSHNQRMTSLIHCLNNSKTKEYDKL